MSDMPVPGPYTGVSHTRFTVGFILSRLIFPSITSECKTRPSHSRIRHRRRAMGSHTSWITVPFLTFWEVSERGFSPVFTLRDTVRDCQHCRVTSCICPGSQHSCTFLHIRDIPEKHAFLRVLSPFLSYIGDLPRFREVYCRNNQEITGNTCQKGV